MALLPMDFKSIVSANSTTPAQVEHCTAELTMLSGTNWAGGQTAQTSAPDLSSRRRATTAGNVCQNPRRTAYLVKTAHQWCPIGAAHDNFIFSERACAVRCVILVYKINRRRCVSKRFFLLQCALQCIPRIAVKRFYCSYGSLKSVVGN